MKPPSVPVVANATSQRTARIMETIQSIPPWDVQLECHLQVAREKRRRWVRGLMRESGKGLARETYEGSRSSTGAGMPGCWKAREPCVRNS
jgi:hypothetical protein